MDVIATAQQGLRNAVATLGTATSEEHLKRLFRIVPSVLFCFDGDAAGRKAAWRALEQHCRTCRTGAAHASCSCRTAKIRTPRSRRGHRRLSRPHPAALAATGRLLLPATERRSRSTLHGRQGSPGHARRTAHRKDSGQQLARADAPAPRRDHWTERRSTAAHGRCAVAAPSSTPTYDDYTYYDASPAYGEPDHFEPPELVQPQPRSSKPGKKEWKKDWKKTARVQT